MPSHRGRSHSIRDYAALTNHERYALLRIAEQGIEAGVCATWTDEQLGKLRGALDKISPRHVIVVDARSFERGARG